ncbi:hypothetical protein [Corallococcus exercitus]|nr:hypothetical protein [Corallococcus exercitus]
MMFRSILVLVAALLADAGTPSPSQQRPKQDAGSPMLPRPAAGTDAGTPAFEWPEDVDPMATLDGPAILASYAALQDVVSRFPKARRNECIFTARALEVVVGKGKGVYIVRVNRRVDHCEGIGPGGNFELDWFELYAVSPEGRIIERYQYTP